MSQNTKVSKLNILFSTLANVLLAFSPAKPNFSLIRPNLILQPFSSANVLFYLGLCLSIHTFFFFKREKNKITMY